MTFFDRHYSNMTIRDGKFYKGDQPVSLEFGNWEQIVLMEKATKAYKALTGPGIGVSVEYEKRGVTGTAYFNCLCGFTITRERDVDEEGDIEPLCGHVTCSRCKNLYELSEGDDNNLIAKLKTKS